MTRKSLSAIGISGSPSAKSRSRGLLEHALARLEARGIVTGVIDLNALPADGLLGRSASAEVTRALAQVAVADIVVASTPVYRATYTGLLKVFFDLFEHHALVGKIGIALASGGAPGHQLALDHGLRPLFTSVGAVVVSTGVYAVDEEIVAGIPNERVRDRIERAVAEAVALADAHEAPSRINALSRAAAP